MHDETIRSITLLALSGFLSACTTPPPGEFPEDAPPAQVAEAPDDATPDDEAPDNDEPASVAEPDGPVSINIENIVRLVYSRSPRVTAAREEMNAAQHGLTEFRANLSRLEPFAEVRSDLADFPNRDGAFGSTMEAVVGIQKETFEGSILTAESGGAYSHFRFSELEEDREQGSGVLVRGRLEKPFLGSRRLQNRVISQAFQESTARKAQLDYLDSYREYVDDSLSYYILYVYYDELVDAYQNYVDDLQALLDDDRLKADDRDRVESVRITAVSNVSRYRSSREEYETILLAELNVGGEAEFTIEDPPAYSLSPYAAQASSDDGLAELIAKARANNPTFKVLNDAIENANLQRLQAIRGRYDVTTFVEGSLFPVGSESFDDRLDGWIVGGGVTVRLNDRKVLNATRLKAEAEIRQFRATLDVEALKMRRRIVTETRGLRDNDAIRSEQLAALEQKREVWGARLAEYFAGTLNVDRLLDARSTVTSTESNLISTIYNSRNRERRLMGAMGEIYDLVGLRIGDNGRLRERMTEIGRVP